MTEPDPTSPETLAATAFMEHKGYTSSPMGVEDVNETCWYFYFEVPEGLIELEVEYARRQWRCAVTTFWTYDTMPEGWTPVDFVQQQRERADSRGG